MKTDATKPLKRFLTLTAVALAAAALLVGLTHAVLVSAQVSDPAATTVYGMTPRRFWATAIILPALLAAAVGGVALARSYRQVSQNNGQKVSAVAIIMGVIVVANGALILTLADGGPGSGNGVVGGAAAFVLGSVAVIEGGWAFTRTRKAA